MEKALLDSKIKKHLNEVMKFLGFAQKDVDFAMELWQPYVTRSNSGEPVDMWGIAFYAKTLVRTLFGAIDASGYLLRKTVVAMAEAGHLPVPNKELAKLKEKRYDATDDAITDQAARFLTTLESFKLAATWFPRIFQEEVSFDFTSSGWHSLTRLYKARRFLTHPSRVEHLLQQDTYVYLQSAAVWYFAAMRELFGVASRNLGKGQQPPSKIPSVAVTTKGFASATDVLDEEFYRIVRQSHGRSLRYATEMMVRLGRETGMAVDLLSDAFGKVEPRNYVKRPLLSDERIQFATRNLLRTFFSEVEGTIGYIEFVLQAAISRGELTLSPAELESLRETEPLEDRLWSATALWSREFGSGSTVDRHAQDWDLFIEAIGWRNRVTHPQEPIGFLLLPSSVEAVLKLPAWYTSRVTSVLVLVP